MNRRVRKLEDRRKGGFASAQAGPADEETKPDCGEFWEMQMWWTALHLVRGLEPDFTLDSEAGDAFVTLGGRFAVSRERMDLRGLMGPRTRALQEAMPRDRWGRFLAADDEAADTYARLIELANTCIVPDDYTIPIAGRCYTQEEADRFANSPHKPTALFVDDEEREDTRRLTWVLVHNADARGMLSFLTRRRDAFVEEEGSMPTDLPTY